MRISTRLRSSIPTLSEDSSVEEVPISVPPELDGILTPTQYQQLLKGEPLQLGRITAYLSAAVVWIAALDNKPLKQRTCRLYGLHGTPHTQYMYAWLRLLVEMPEPLYTELLIALKEEHRCMELTLRTWS